jgi:micrococcal nuclease
MSGRRLLLLLSLVLFLVGPMAWSAAARWPAHRATHRTAKPLVPVRPGAVIRSYVRYVVDGDTLELDGLGRVRLLGIDAPEKAALPWGPAATALTRRLAEHQPVTVEFEGPTHDRYNRALVYLYLPDGTCLNTELLVHGLAWVLTRYPFSRMDSYLRVASWARKRHLGVWSEG